MPDHNKFGLAGKTALVSGGAQGHGLQVAINLGQEGLHIVLADIDKEKGNEAVEAIRSGGGKADFFLCGPSLTGFCS